MVAAMEDANLQVYVHVAELPVVVTKTAWLSFIRNKTWSEFSMCTEEEMRQGNITYYIDDRTNVFGILFANTGKVCNNLIFVPPPFSTFLGLAELESRFHDKTTLQFNEKLIFVVGKKQ